MANNSLSYLTGSCIPPFLDAARFPTTGGSIDGRFCAPIIEGNSKVICCLPCPTTAWTYPDSFETYMTVAEWLGVVGLFLLVFMLLSYLVLPTQKTRSHYLSVCLIVSVIMITIGFTIPLAASPEQCYNEITPNDMYSSSKCAWSGAFVIAGGLSAVMWIFIRALSMNLQICWDIVPGRKFFYISQAAGWGIPAVLFTATMTVTGVSFRFGNICHVNHANSMADFWGPLLALAGSAGVLQLTTFGYCARVYFNNLFADQAPTSTSASGSVLPSIQGSTRNQTARAVWRRLQKVLFLQWRGICIVTIILVDVIFFSIVFVRLDTLQTSLSSNLSEVKPWIGCLAFHPSEKDLCVPLVGKFLVNESTVVAVLFLLALTGLQVFLFLARPSVFPAWSEFIAAKFESRSEFVSLDARPEVMRTNSKQELINYTRGHDSTTFEMQTPITGMQDMRYELDSKALSPTQTILSSPDDVYQSPRYISRDGTAEFDTQSHSLYGPARIPPGYTSRMSPDLGINTNHSPVASPTSPPTPVVRYDSISLYRQPSSDYFHSAPPRPSTSHSTSSERRYNAPHHSFSGPTAPSRQSSLRSVSFDPRDTHSRGGLALNPPSEAGESREDLSGNSLDNNHHHHHHHHPHHHYGR